MLTAVNQCQPFELHNPMLACYVRDVLTLVYFLYLDKNPRWVTDDNGYEDFPEDF